MKFLIEDCVTYDSEKGVLHHHNGDVVHLRKTENSLLICLIEGTQDKRSIIKYVWPSTIVTNSSYYKAIFDLRNQMITVGLSPALIKTIPRKGVAFHGQCKQINGDEASPEINTPSGHVLQYESVSQTMNNSSNALPLTLFARAHFLHLLSGLNISFKIISMYFFVAMLAFFGGFTYMKEKTHFALKKINENDRVVFLLDDASAPSSSHLERAKYIYVYQNPHAKTIYSCLERSPGKIKCVNNTSYY